MMCDASKCVGVCVCSASCALLLYYNDSLSLCYLVALAKPEASQTRGVVVAECLARGSGAAYKLVTGAAAGSVVLSSFACKCGYGLCVQDINSIHPRSSPCGNRRRGRGHGSSRRFVAASVPGAQVYPLRNRVPCKMKSSACK